MAVVAISGVELGLRSRWLDQPGGTFTCPPICGSGDETKFADQGIFIP